MNIHFPVKHSDTRHKKTNREEDKQDTKKKKEKYALQTSIFTGMLQEKE
jgi:hypothetical protein